MAALRPPHFSRDRTGPVHDPLLGEEADPTQAATSLQSGTFQYVNSAFLNNPATSPYLSQVSASAIDPGTGTVYLLRRASPNFVILDSNGEPKPVPDPAMITGHSIKLIDIGNGPQPWVVDMGSSTVRIYDTDGTFQQSFGPNIAGSSVEKQDDIGIPEDGQSVTLGKITDIAFDPQIGQFYITDGNVGGPYNRIVVLNTTLACVAVWDASSPVSSSGVNGIQLNGPHAVAVDPWSRVWIVDSQNDRVQVADQTGLVLGTWNFPGVTLYGISISIDRAPSTSTAMIYLTGNSGSGSNTGTIMLLETEYNPDNSSDIGSNIPLTTWNNQPGTLLHWVSCGTVAQEAMMLVNDLSGVASAYQLSVPRPMFQIPSSPLSPLWPSSFYAVALFHPFEKDLQVFATAEIWYTESTSMQVDMYTLTGIKLSYKYQVTGGQTQYQVSVNDLPYSSPQQTSQVIPACDWIVKATEFQGQLPLLGEQTNWWYETVKKTGNCFWHWFRSDTNVPWRTMNSDDTAPDNIPILQDWAFINWPTFTASSSELQQYPHAYSHGEKLPQDVAKLVTDPTISSAVVLGNLVQLDKQGKLPITREERLANLAKLGELVPGLSPGDDGLPLPVWQHKFFMTCTMTAINAPYPMSSEVLYDWDAPELQRTRMFDWDQQSTTDAILTTDPSPRDLGHDPGTTYLINRFMNGTFKCLPPIPNIGPVPPNWPAADNAVIVATIKNNPQLSPGCTMRIFHCPFDPSDPKSQSQFWIWYSDQYDMDTPVVFCQTLPPAEVGTNLALADYQRLQTTPLIDQIAFTVPATCKGAGKTK